jgi:hypothetical protein
VIGSLSDESRRELFTARIQALGSAGLLTDGQVQGLIQPVEGNTSSADNPPFNPDGSPSLCGFLGAASAAQPEIESAAGVALGAAGGAAIGSLGGPAGAAIGAAIGALVMM